MVLTSHNLYLKYILWLWYIMNLLKARIMYINASACESSIWYWSFASSYFSTSCISLFDVSLLWKYCFFYRFHQKKKRFHSCQKIESIFHELAAHYNKQATAYNIRQQLRLELPAVCDSFEWNSDSSAPDMYTSPILFRPVPPDSPVGLDFDHGKAIVGM